MCIISNVYKKSVCSKFLSIPAALSARALYFYCTVYGQPCLLHRRYSQWGDTVRLRVHIVARFQCFMSTSP
jgi:hypothetical protein